MDGQSRAKLVLAGYAIFRQRDVYAVTCAALPPGVAGRARLEIREMSSRGDWVLQGKYRTKAARERAWKELMKDPMHLAEIDR